MRFGCKGLQFRSLLRHRIVLSILHLRIDLTDRGLILGLEIISLGFCGFGPQVSLKTCWKCQRVGIYPRIGMLLVTFPIIYHGFSMGHLSEDRFVRNCGYLQIDVVGGAG